MTVGLQGNGVHHVVCSSSRAEFGVHVSGEIQAGELGPAGAIHGVKCAAQQNLAIGLDRRREDKIVRAIARVKPSVVRSRWTIE